MSNDSRITMSGLDISFGNLTWFLVKVSIAAIPAAIIVAVVWGVLAAILAGVFGGLAGAF